MMYLLYFAFEYFSIPKHDLPGHFKWQLYVLKGYKINLSNVSLIELLLCFFNN